MKRIRTERHRTGLRALVAVAAALVVAVAAPAAAAGRFGGGSYGWPVRPFDRQHPVRGFFGDPRIGETPYGVSRSFHFGIDVCAPNGTPVYATQSGRVVIEPVRPETVLVYGDGGRMFAYWHIRPAVSSGSYVRAYATVVGHVLRPWAHVHFAELQGHRYVNPLRPGALGPYRDWTRPLVHAFSFERNGVPLGRTRLHGAFDIVAEVFDRTPLRVPPPWSDKPVMPALVSWRLLRGAAVVVPWRVAVDFRDALPDAWLYDACYARWTRQNHASRTGRYRIRLTRGWSTAAARPGTYRVEVLVSDTRGNATRSAATFSVGG